jgi:hypothetical protein
VQVDSSRYREIPENPHQIRAGAVLLPTAAPIVAGGGTSFEFIHAQGGDDETFVLMLGERMVGDLLGGELEVLEGVFLSPKGPGFHPTWDFHQLMRETDLGGWTVVPVSSVLTEWVDRVETRMNL